MNERKIAFEVDPKIVQATGIETIEGRLSIFGNSIWEILRNNLRECPFFTSDYPVALEETEGNTVNWVVPLAPDLAVRIIPDTNLARAPKDFSFSHFRYLTKALSRAEVVDINRLIVRCAEELVFYRDDRPWVLSFVARNRNYRVEAATDRIELPRGFLNISRQMIVMRGPADRQAQ